MEGVEIHCVQCGTTHQVNANLAGRRVRCPGCNTAIHVPEIPIEAQVAEAVVVEAEPVIVDAEPVAAVAAASVASIQSPGDETVEAQTPPVSEMEDDPDTAMPPRKKRDEEELDMTPMVDVTFLLLIFFMVTASFSLQKSIEMPRQQTDAPSTNAVEEDPEELDQVELQIDERGGFLVLAADWEMETPGKQNLIAKLKDARTEGGEAKLIIKVHEEAKLRFLVDGMDAGTIAGYNEVQVTQVDEFD